VWYHKENSRFYRVEPKDYRHLVMKIVWEMQHDPDLVAIYYISIVVFIVFELRGCIAHSKGCASRVQRNMMKSVSEEQATQESTGKSRDSEVCWSDGLGLCLAWLHSVVLLRNLRSDCTCHATPGCFHQHSTRRVPTERVNTS